jgi:hypothetical protein
MPTSEPTDPMYGALCLNGFAQHFGESVSLDDSSDHILCETAKQNTQYVIVHMYLIPGDVRTRRELREAIHSELGKLNAIQLHDLAYAVPTYQSGERETVSEVWVHLMYAGAEALGKGKPDAWEKGDVVYVHYMANGEMTVLAVAPRTGLRLPQEPTG